MKSVKGWVRKRQIPSPPRPHQREEAGMNIDEETMKENDMGKLRGRISELENERNNLILEISKVNDWFNQKKSLQSSLTQALKAKERKKAQGERVAKAFWAERKAKEDAVEVLIKALAWAGSNFPDCPPGPLPWEKEAKQVLSKLKERG